MAMPTPISTMPPSASPRSPVLGTQEAAEVEPDQGHGDADRADHHRCSEQSDTVYAERKADRKVVDAQRKPGDQEHAEAPACPVGGAVAVAPECLNELVEPGGDQGTGAHPAGGMPEGVGQGAAQQQAKQAAWRSRQAEHYADVQPRPGVARRSASPHSTAAPFNSPELLS